MISDDEKVKIQVLLTEYNSLRAEAVARSGHLFQLVAAAGAASAFIMGAFIAWLSQYNLMARPIFWLSLGLIIFAGLAVVLAARTLGMMSFRDLEKAVARVAEIELDVNKRVGEDLLIWENLCGGRVTSYWVKVAPCLPRSALKGRNPPVQTKGGDPLTV